MKTETTDYHTVSGTNVGMHFQNPITTYRPRSTFSCTLYCYILYTYNRMGITLHTSYLTR
jgi:hypothetical protein